LLEVGAAAISSSPRVVVDVVLVVVVDEDVLVLLATVVDGDRRVVVAVREGDGAVVAGAAGAPGAAGAGAGGDWVLAAMVMVAGGPSEEITPLAAFIRRTTVKVSAPSASESLMTGTVKVRWAAGSGPISKVTVPETAV